MAMESGNIDVMRNTIQQYICQYGRDWSRFRDVRIQLVDGNTYAQLSAVDLIQQLHWLILSSSYIVLSRWCTRILR